MDEEGEPILDDDGNYIPVEEEEPSRRVWRHPLLATSRESAAVVGRRL